MLANIGVQGVQGGRLSFPRVGAKVRTSESNKLLHTDEREIFKRYKGVRVIMVQCKQWGYRFIGRTNGHYIIISPRARDVWTPRVRGVRAAPAATTLMPRVQGINEGVDTTSNPPKDTGREDEEGSTQAPARDTDATASVARNKLLRPKYCQNEVTSHRWMIVVQIPWCSRSKWAGVKHQMRHQKIDIRQVQRQDPRDLRVVRREPGIDHPFQRNTAGCEIAFKPSREGHIAEGSQRGHERRKHGRKAAACAGKIKIR
ncbi:hypothetical protein B0H17DRAFT_1144994 [Mycena rosella]|uniref:Uncharacterized protein n=1 Tax=Mycena rosella TaxID=1033263 RepID=A0AAD7CS17_MYCRO|nr:hypothetical protein B0H17DRAFT_1144994 [Mycena rosella]